jgi:cyclophilin family peptidyl-prolyl cis-trans isomerase
MNIKLRFQVFIGMTYSDFCNWLKMVPVFVVAVVLLAMLSLSSARADDQRPDLIFYAPTGWSGAVVVSAVKGTSTDAAAFPSACYFLDWAVANYSATDAASPFIVRLLVDGANAGEWTIATLPGMNYTYRTDLPLFLTAGTHTLQIVIDPLGAIVELNEENNAYTRTLTVADAVSAGIIAARPAAHDFGEVTSGRDAGKIIHFTNSGPGGMQIETVSLSGVDAGAFTITADGCSGKTLPPPNCPGPCAASCTVTVNFSPQKIETAYATLNLADAADTLRSQVALSGAAEPGVGDFNGDGRISLDDALLPLKILSGGYAGDTFRVDAGFTENAPVGAADAIRLLQVLSGLRTDDLYELVRIQTRFGAMLIQLYDETPLHRDNFLTLAKSGYYDGLIFHRLIEDFMVQGGDPLGTGSGGPGYTICPEIKTGLTHDFGAVAAARLADSVNPEKNSSGSQFYIVNNPAGAHFLDGNYTVFGRVVDGLDVILAIADAKTDDDDRPLTPIVMEKVEVVILSRAQCPSCF